MSIKFTAASSQRLIQDGAVAGNLPNLLYNLSSGNAANTFTIGFWIYVPAISVAAEFYNMCRQADVNKGWIFQATSGNVWNVYSNGNAQTGGAVTVGWHYVLIYLTNGADVRISVLQANGSIADIALTTSSNFTWFGEPSQSLGARFNGAVATDYSMAEFWSAYGNVVVPGGGAAVNSGLLRQLAYRGPFSVPRIRKDIVEYRSFRSGTHQPVNGEVYFGSKGIQTWTPVNGPTLGLHPPHAQPWNPQYIRPGAADYIVPVYVPDAIVPASGHRSRLLLMGVG